MERRVLLAIFLCFLVLYLWQTVFVKPEPRRASTTTTASKAATGTPPVAGVAEGAIPAPAQPASQPVAAAVAALVGETSERDIRVETSDVIAVFTNRGARLKSWQLKRYLNQQRRPQELIENQLGTQPLPFTLRTPDEQVNATLNTVLYRAVSSGKTDLRFEYRDSAGVHAVKEFHLDQSSYLVTFHGTVTAGDRTLPVAIVWGPAVGDVGETTRATQAVEALLFENGKPLRLSQSDIAKQPAREGSFRYAGVDDNYFMTVALDPGPCKVTYQPVSIPPPADSKAAARALLSYTIEPQQSGGAVKFFVGPKDLDVLTAMDRDFASAINFGWFAPIVVPLLQSLKWVNGYVGNWGWSIVVLTVIINLIMAPLRHKQVVSMRKMQEIQPEVKAIQDRYGKLKTTDPAKQKMNQEVMALYKEKKVNPASGCVPMLLTMPIMIAMWAVLQTAIELRGASWFGWIHDLSGRDPYYILPGLMVGTQFWQQAMMPPAGADPAQQKMMKFMPLVMGFIFFSLPSGALLYYVVGTVFGIGQQYLTNYLIGPPNVRTVRPAAEHRTKRGGGKTDG